jgi:3-oxoadipate enol-lactonase
MVDDRDTDPSGTIEVDGVRLAYRVDGPATAPALVLSNSLDLDRRMWQPQIAALARRFRVVRYDQRGHGRSSVPAGPYTLDRLGGDLLALVDALQVGRAHICGISLGGLVAQWLAVRHPDRVDRVILANTGARIGTEAGWDDRIRRVHAGGMEAIRDLVVGRFLSAPFRQVHPDIVRWVGDLLVATAPEGYVATCEALRAAGLRGEVGAIRAPTLVMAGGLDESTPGDHSHALHAAIAGSKLVILPDAAHLSNVEQP